MGSVFEKTRGGRTRWTRKEVLVCVQYVLGKKKSVFQFGDSKKREISASSLSYLCEKEEFGKEVDKT